jgi:F-type H+-transporting ATPase subunit c
VIRKLKTLVPALAVLALASVNTFAQGAAENSGHFAMSDDAWKAIAAGFAMAIAAYGAASAQGKGLAAACTATARNPQAGGRIFTMMLIGLAFIETMALYMFVISFTKLLK